MALNHQVQQFNLLPGVNLYYIADARMKTTSLYLYLHRPLSRDEATKNALLASVLKRGTEKLPDMRAINVHLEELFGLLYDIGVTKKGPVQSLSFSFNTIADRFAGEGLLRRAVDVMLDFLLTPKLADGAFDPAYVAGEKKNLKDTIESLVNDKRAYASYRCLEELCKGDPSGIFEYGYVADLDGIDAKSLYAHYRDILTKSPIDIFVVGEADIPAVVGAFQDRLGGLGISAAPLRLETGAPRPAGVVRTIEEAFDVTQGKLALGLRTGTTVSDGDYYALVVGNSILGAGAHSKLFNNVREKKSLCYYVSSRIDKFTPIMMISSGIEFDKYKEAKKEILFQLEAVKKGFFDENELEIARDFVISQYQSYLDSPYLLQSYYLGLALSGNTDTIADAVEKVRAVTTEDVVRAFCKIGLDVVYFLKGKEGDAQ